MPTGGGGGGGLHGNSNNVGQESKPVGQERARRELTNPLPPRAFLNGGEGESQGKDPLAAATREPARAGLSAGFNWGGILVLGLSELCSSGEG